MKWTIVVSAAPASGDVVYNALRLAREACGRDNEVRVFLVNDAVDSARADFPAGEVRDLLHSCMADGIPVKVCATCVTRCGIGKGAVHRGATMAAMADLADWIEDADRVLTF